VVLPGFGLPKETPEMEKADEWSEPSPGNHRSEPGPTWIPFLACVFRGPNGLRAGWRLVIFFVVLGTFAEIWALSFQALSLRYSREGQFAGHGFLANFTWWAIHTKAPWFVVVLIATWLVAVLEDRRFASFGLPLKRAFRKSFWQGAAIGFAAITSLLFAMRLLGLLQFGSVSLHGALVAKYAILSGVACFFTGLYEESLFRGYVQFTLTTGVGFWPAAVITSGIFGYMHHGNSGETMVGMFSAAGVGFLFCLLLRRTGDLWMPVGFHVAWNWSESYFFGVTSSGIVSSTRLFRTTFSGPPWLTGGTAGPEGSWLCLIFIAILFVVLARWLPEVKYSNEGAHRRGSTPEPQRALQARD
jgi:CAAX protease family protein